MASTLAARTAELQSTHIAAYGPPQLEIANVAVSLDAKQLDNRQVVYVDVRCGDDLFRTTAQARKFDPMAPAEAPLAFDTDRGLLTLVPPLTERTHLLMCVRRCQLFGDTDVCAVEVPVGALPLVRDTQLFFRTGRFVFGVRPVSIGFPPGDPRGAAPGLGGSPNAPIDLGIDVIRELTYQQAAEADGDSGARYSGRGKKGRKGGRRRKAGGADTNAPDDSAQNNASGSRYDASGRSGVVPPAPAVASLPQSESTIAPEIPPGSQAPPPAQPPALASSNSTSSVSRIAGDVVPETKSISSAAPAPPTAAPAAELYSEWHPAEGDADDNSNDDGDEEDGAALDEPAAASRALGGGPMALEVIKNEDSVKPLHYRGDLPADPTPPIPIGYTRSIRLRGLLQPAAAGGGGGSSSGGGLKSLFGAVTAAVSSAATDMASVVDLQMMRGHFPTIRSPLVHVYKPHVLNGHGIPIEGTLYVTTTEVAFHGPLLQFMVPFGEMPYLRRTTSFGRDCIQLFCPGQEVYQLQDLDGLVARFGSAIGVREHTKFYDCYCLLVDLWRHARGMAAPAS